MYMIHLKKRKDESSSLPLELLRTLYCTSTCIVHTYVHTFPKQSTEYSRIINTYIMQPAQNVVHTIAITTDTNKFIS